MLRAQIADILPSREVLQREFGAHDREAFNAPEKVFYPETWFHFIGGNVSYEGINELEIEVTSTWFNRLVYDASLPENERKTWTIAGPSAGRSLQECGLMGPVKLIY